MTDAETATAKEEQRQQALSLTECAVLGLLAPGEQSGYDLLRYAEQSVRFFWAPSRSQLYAILPRLVERGYATVRHVEQESRPDKQVYRITPAGLDALREGLGQAFPHVARNPFELKLFLGEHLAEGQARRLIESFRDGAAEHRERLQGFERELEGDGESFFPYLLVLLAIENQEAGLRWADRALALLAERGL